MYIALQRSRNFASRGVLCQVSARACVYGPLILQGHSVRYGRAWSTCACRIPRSRIIQCSRRGSRTALVVGSTCAAHSKYRGACPPAEPAGDTLYAASSLPCGGQRERTFDVWPLVEPKQSLSFFFLFFFPAARFAYELSQGVRCEYRCIARIYRLCVCKLTLPSLYQTACDICMWLSPSHFVCIAKRSSDAHRE